jgi:hypothetical protein
MSNASTRLIRLGSAALASAVVLGAAASTAGATRFSGNTGNSGIISDTGNSGSSATPQTLSAIKAKAQADVTHRVNALNAAIAEVNAASGLGSDQGALVAYLKTDIAPLQQLNDTIQADTSVKQAEKDFSSVLSNYRVYVLVLPAATLASEADRATITAIPNLTKASSQALSLENPRNQAEVQPVVNDLNGQISTASTATSGLASTVLALTPTQWNANHNLLSGPKSAAHTAVSALQKSRSDVAQILSDLKGSAGGSLSTTGAGGSTGNLRGSGLGSALRTLRGATTTTS